MVEKATPRNTTLKQVYLIIGLFVVLIALLVGLVQIQMNVLMGIRAYVGAEGMWAKAQKDAIRSLEHYAISRNEDDYRSYLRYIQVPLADYKARIELQKPSLDPNAVRVAILAGGNHPDDVEYLINLFVRFQHVSFMAEAIQHWTQADQFLEKLNSEAIKLHENISAKNGNPVTLGELVKKMDGINRQLTEQEDLFSSTLATASRVASDISRNITNTLAFIFTLLGVGISWRIVTRIRNIESELFDTEENLRTILNVSPIAVRISIKRGRQVVFYNRSYGELIQNINAQGDDPKKYYARPKEYEEILAELKLGNSVINREIELNIHDGSTVWTMASYMPIKYLEEEAVLGWFFDISHIKMHEAELQRVAHYDLLTGIPNRVLLADRMKQAIAQTAREQNMMAVCYVDLDGFKPINDAMGHEAGDQVLVEVAKRIGSTIRGGDTCARLGGDEFVLLLLGLKKSTECVATLERLLAAITQPMVVKGKSISLSASIGVSIYPLDDEAPDTLMRHADQAMYVAKQTGKSRFHIYDPALDRRSREQHNYSNAIHNAIENNQFRLYFQPKVNLRSGKMVGVEALIRWQHPERGLLSPAEFLRIIENTDLDIAVGEWVIAAALAQMSSWRNAGLHIEVSINISGYHLESSGFAKKLNQQLASYPDTESGALQIEVLETVALNDITAVRELIESCRKIGIGFALDDFGTGYASLSYLSALPVDVLKIDQSFVRDMLEDKGDMAIVQGIIALARTFNRKIVAEGIETNEQYQALLDLGCEVGQGYFIARPMSADALVAWAKDKIEVSAT